MHNSFIASTSLAVVSDFKEITFKFINFLLFFTEEWERIAFGEARHMLETLACEALKVILKAPAESIIDSICFAFFSLFFCGTLHADTE